MVYVWIYLVIWRYFRLEEIMCLVPSTGFEPVAYGLEIRYLIPVCRQEGFPRSSYGT